MDSSLKKKLRVLSLALRHTLEGSPGQAGDLESRLNQMGVWRDRPPKPVEELRLSAPDLAARRIVDAFLNYRQEAGISQKEAFAEFVRESAYTWANRLFMLRCLESRGLIDEVILQKQVYGGRSLVHHRFAQQSPSVCAGEDDGLFSVLEEESRRRAAELPTVFDPQAPAVTLRPSVSALKRCIALLSGTALLNGQGEATDELFEAGDAPGWAYQFWNAEEKDRVFEKLRTEKGAKIEGADLIPATQLYTEPYMVKFLVQNSLGALWAGMYPATKLPDSWEYYVRDADRTLPVQADPPPFEPTKAPKPSADSWARPNPKLYAEADIVAYARTLAAKVPGVDCGGFIDLRNQLLDAVIKPELAKLTSLNQEICKAWDREWPARRPKLKKPAADITFLDPACGSGHFLLEAFDLLYAMYEEEGILATPEEICASILSHNLFGIDIDERAIQISVAALWMHALKLAPTLKQDAVTGLGDHIIAANLSLPRGRAHPAEFLAKHPEDAELRPALEAVFRGLADANQLGTLLRIEEPVQEELRRRKEEEDRRAETVLRKAQTKLDFMSEQLVLSVSASRDYAAWEHDVLNRLKEHFRQEAGVSDPVQGFFGRDAGQGLDLFELLARRYDVVAANPPYMGSGNMGPIIKRYCLTQFSLGRRDLYAAFMERCRQLSRPDGYVAMVAQQSWIFLRSFADLRIDILRRSTIECIAHLGEHGFNEASAAGAFVALFCLRTATPTASHKLTALRLIGPKSPEEKESLLRLSVRGNRLLFQRQQGDFLLIDRSPITYWLSDALLALIRDQPQIKSKSYVRQGICTTDNPRFIRYFWELPFKVGGSRWFLFAKGGGTQRWAGLNQVVVDWQYNGRRVKKYQEDTPGAIHWSGRMPDESYFFRLGWTFSRVGRGTIGARELSSSGLFCDTSPAAIPYRLDDLPVVGFWLNTRLLSYLLRAMTQSLDCREGYVQRLPIPDSVTKEHATEMNDASLQLRRALVQVEYTESEYSSIDDCLLIDSNMLGFATEALYLTNEAFREKTAFDAVGLGDQDVRLVLDDIGVPAGLLPILEGFDTLPTAATSNSLPDVVRKWFANITRVSLTNSELADAKQKLRQAYLGAVGQLVEASEESESTSDNDDDESDIASASAIPIPPETRLERLCNASALHPVSVVCILTQMTHDDGLTCPAEVRRGTEDYVSAQILRMLGYQWPKDLERGTPLPDWSDLEGLIPLSDGHEKPNLAWRMSGRLRSVFDSAANWFEQRVGLPLDRWLEREFYPRHIRQFRSRPIVWQVETRPSGRGATPLFSCLMYSHRAAGALPNLRTQHVGILRTSFESELRTLEGLTQTSDQAVRKGKLGFWIDELSQFQETLEDIEAGGFATPQLRRYAIADAIHSIARRWLSRLRGELRSGPLPAWEKKAAEENLHLDLPAWISEAVQHVDRQCVAVAPDPPLPDTPDENLTAAALVELFRGQAPPMIHSSLEAICREWQSQFDKLLLQPLREQIKAAEEEYKQLEDNVENKLLRKDLKSKVKVLKSEIAALAAKSRALADQICEWRCQEAEEWVEWLATQPLFDEFTSLDGRRPVPKTIAEFVSQESQYAPDINDGIRVNIAPLQKAGILARDVLAAKDSDKAIADRAEWRADERRWCRQGVLPQPGWWTEVRISATNAQETVSSTVGM